MSASACRESAEKEEEEEEKGAHELSRERWPEVGTHLSAAASVPVVVTAYEHQLAFEGLVLDSLANVAIHQVIFNDELTSTKR